MFVSLLWWFAVTNSYSSCHLLPRKLNKKQCLPSGKAILDTAPLSPCQHSNPFLRVGGTVFPKGAAFAISYLTTWWHPNSAKKIWVQFVYSHVVALGLMTSKASGPRMSGPLMFLALLPQELPWNERHLWDIPLLCTRLIAVNSKVFGMRIVFRSVGPAPGIMSFCKHEPVHIILLIQCYPLVCHKGAPSALLFTDGELRYQVVKWIVQGHTTGQYQSWE